MFYISLGYREIGGRGGSDAELEKKEKRKLIYSRSYLP